MRVVTPLNNEGMGKLRRLWATGELCRPATVPVPPLVADIGGLLSTVLPLFPLLATAMDGGRREEPRVLLLQCGSKPGRPWGVRRRPCSSSLSTLQVAAVSETTDRSSESFPWSFFCFVRRFWNQTLTWGKTEKNAKSYLCDEFSDYTWNTVWKKKNKRLAIKKIVALLLTVQKVYKYNFGITDNHSLR